jgi:hypothetical protein
VNHDVNPSGGEAMTPDANESFRWRYCSCPDVRRSRRDVAS